MSNDHAWEKNPVGPGYRHVPRPNLSKLAEDYPLRASGALGTPQQMTITHAVMTGSHPGPYTRSACGKFMLFEIINEQHPRWRPPETLVTCGSCRRGYR